MAPALLGGFPGWCPRGRSCYCFSVEDPVHVQLRSISPCLAARGSLRRADQPALVHRRRGLARALGRFGRRRGRGDARHCFGGARRRRGDPLGLAPGWRQNAGAGDHADDGAARPGDRRVEWVRRHHSDQRESLRGADPLQERVGRDRAGPGRKLDGLRGRPLLRLQAPVRRDLPRWHAPRRQGGRDQLQAPAR